ncbi:MAG TPA: bifunctional sulfate adenylyltransferase/adenylylsulfate kinase [Thermoanaerobaculia bacterium]|nr:bifunctional sulfate adenylyltransferase/adenylylsulfate kinase [Thermoanaerobaculia bacterium]
MSLIEPYGGELVDLLDPDAMKQAATLRSIQLSDRAVCDLELLANGAFSPLDRFLSAGDYRSVLDSMRLADGTLFPMPITLPVADDVRVGEEIALRNAKNDLLAVMRVDEVYAWDRDEFARKVLGTTDVTHPLVAELQRWGTRNISGPLRVLRLPTPPDFRELRRTPAEVRALLAETGRANVVAFQTRNPLHRVHEEMTRRAIDQVDGVLLLHPSVGMTKPGDVDHYTRVRTYRAVAGHYDQGRIVLSLLPLAMRMAGPREALWHAVIRRNFGASHFIVGRDHASPGAGFYGPFDAQQLVAAHAEEIGVTMMAFDEMVFIPGEQRYEERSRVPAGRSIITLSGTQVRDKLAAGEPLPEWFTRPDVAVILGENYPPRHRQGFCIWLTGLSGAGKSTTADMLVPLLMERGRRVTLLDGDVVRTHLSKGLGFSREDRDANILRIGFVASEIVRHGGAVVCAAVSPFRATRESVRGMVGAEHFLEVFVDTPLDVCESRDPKGMYAQARSGAIKGFTGIDDPYEAPLAPELTLDTVAASAEANARRIVEALRGRGFVI